MPVTYKLISTITVSTATQAAIEFTSIPATFDDLVVFSSLRSNRTPSTDGSHIAFTFNNNTSTVYSYKQIRGNGAAASSYGESSANQLNFYASANSAADIASTFSNNSFYIPNYAGSTNKSMSADSVYENNGTTAYQHLFAALWASSAAITSIKLAEAFGNSWVQYSSASLYGIKKS
jgi:hypothetical protein